jgi:dihydroflavonol-4-reductase
MIIQHMKKGDLCLVTGITGFLASWIAKYLLEDGYFVRGTVRNLNDVKRISKMRELLPGVEFAEVDLRVESGWTKAVDGCKWVFHVASPLAMKNEIDRTGAAIAGTKHLLQAVFKSITVEKVVLTSSEAAIAYGFPANKRTFSEDDWTDINGPGVGDYFRSKTMAERLAWDMVNDGAQNLRHIPLSTINPSLILGPTLVPWERFSLDIIKRLAEGKIPFLADVTIYFVDVRDCARMHIKSMNSPGTDGNRHLSFGASGKFAEVALAVREGYANFGFVPSTRNAPKWLFWVMKFFVDNVAAVYTKIGQDTIYNTKYPAFFSYQYRNLSEIVHDTIDGLIEHGWLKPKNLK